MDQTLKDEIINSIVKSNLTQTAASKLFGIPQPKISILLKDEGYTSIVENGKTIYFKVDKKQTSLETSLLVGIDLKVSIIQKDLSQLLIKEIPKKQIKKESFKLTLKKIYNSSMYDAKTNNLNTRAERRSFRIPKYVLDQLDDHILDTSEKFSIFITGAILSAIQNSQNDNL